jgi:hypothetical protein
MARGPVGRSVRLALFGPEGDVERAEMVRLLPALLGAGGLEVGVVIVW